MKNVINIISLFLIACIVCFLYQEHIEYKSTDNSTIFHKNSGMDLEILPIGFSKKNNLDFINF